MIAAFGVLPPLVSVFTYRRAGVRWSRAAGLAAIALLFSAAGGIVCGLALGFGVSVESGLCGETPWEAEAAGVVAYLVIATWAASRPARVWAWALTIGPAIAAGMLVAYFFAGAHHYCET